MSDTREPIPAPRRRLGAYLLLTELARGGMCEVFLARKEGTAELCVVKQLKSGLLGNTVVEMRFEREAALCAMLAHPGIARVFDSELEAGTFSLAMELIPGQTVADLVREVLIRRERVPVEVAVTIALRMLDALAYAHDATDAAGKPLHLVHRDLSARNVMVSYFGGVKLIDFGLARGNLGDFQTKPGQLLGTLRYVSPEQARGEPVDRRTDLYSTGVILFEMLAGRALFRNDQPVRTLRAIMYDPLPEPDTFGEDAPVAIKRAILRALAKDAADRPATAKVMAEELRAGLGASAELEAEALGAYVRGVFPAHARVMLELLRVHGEAGMAIVSSDSETDAPRTAVTDVTLPGASDVYSALTPIDRSETEADTDRSLSGMPEPEPEPSVAETPVVPAPTRILGARRRKRRQEVERLERAMRRWRMVALATALAAIAAVTALFSSMTSVNEPVIPILQPLPAARPAAAQRAEPEAAQPAPVPAETAEPVVPAKTVRPRPRRSPDPTEPPKDRDPRALLRTLRAEPKNVPLFEELYETIEREAQKLPQPKRAPILSALNTASLTADVEALARALDALEAAAKSR